MDVYIMKQETCIRYTDIYKQVDEDTGEFGVAIYNDGNDNFCLVSYQGNHIIYIECTASEMVSALTGYVTEEDL